ncbi:MAG: hypothetical protein J7639_10425 [Paenibacillaceae bacterium]|nr:hypothetical protein [Paenibacillaceae bacterium]
MVFKEHIVTKFILVGFYVFVYYMITGSVNLLESPFYLFLLLAAIVALSGMYYKIEDGFLIKYVVFFPMGKKIEVNRIRHIVKISKRTAGHVNIKIGKSPKEDEYQLFMYSNESVKISSTYSNNDRQTIGNYIIKQYKVKCSEEEQVKYFS